MKPEVKMTEEDEKEADEVLSSAGSSNSASKFRYIDSSQYYIVEEDVSDDEDIDPKHYQSPTYQR